MFRRVETGVLLAFLLSPLICRAQWRPSYQPVAATYGIRNDSFQLTMQYSQWQGYFNNVYTVPAGIAAHCTSQRNTCLQVMHAFSDASHMTAERHRIICDHVKCLLRQAPCMYPSGGLSVRLQAVMSWTQLAISHGTWAPLSLSP